MNQIARSDWLPARDHPLYPATSKISPKADQKPYYKSFIDEVSSITMAG